MTNLTPSCRYGHGDLAQDDGVFALVGVTVAKPEPGVISANHNDRVFVLKAFRCTVCGYIELFDHEV